MFFMDEKTFLDYMNNKEFYSIDFNENISSHFLNESIDEYGIYYLVIKTKTKSEMKIEINKTTHI